MSSHQKQWLALVALLILAAGFRLSVAHWLANDAPDDGRVYAQMARNLLEQHVYSNETEAPYDPSLIRVPGYPLFLAGVYSVFGHANNSAVRIIQALIDTATCGLVALLAFQWQPDERRKLVTAIAALALAAVNPFTTIYAATILTEVPAMFFALATCVTATIALRADDPGQSLKWWFGSGLLAALGTMFRPDSGLFFAVICLTLAIVVLVRFRAYWRRAIVAFATLSVAFTVVLGPWTVRNWRTLHLFQPLAPFSAEMPDVFVPSGYIRWLKTWIDDPQYIDPFWWQLNVEPMTVETLPARAFDSAAERERVAALFDQYNHPVPAVDVSAPSLQPQPGALPNPSPDQPGDAGGKKDQNDDRGDQADENDHSNSEQADDSQPDDAAAVKMTPEIDAAFGELANQRIARHPLRYYLWVPAKRARVLWFNTHSDFYPFEGALLRPGNPDYQASQQIRLTVFAALVAIFTLLGLGGVALLWMTRDFYARTWALLVVLIIVTRLAFFSTIVSPEPRYVVELFPFLAALGAISIARLFKRKPAPPESALLMANSPQR